MKTPSVMAVALLVLLGGVAVAHSAEPQDANPTPLLSSTSTATPAPANQAPEPPKFFAQPLDNALDLALRGRCERSCNLCLDDADCYFDGNFYGPCSTGFCY